MCLCTFGANKYCITSKKGTIVMNETHNTRTKKKKNDNLRIPKDSGAREVSYRSWLIGEIPDTRRDPSRPIFRSVSASTRA